MEVKRLAIPDVILVTPPKFADNRGFFSETYNARKMAEAGIPDVFVQDNQSLSRQKGVIRGLHCQLQPHGQGKLVRCTKGAIWDVAVDARTGSPTYGNWVAEELSEDNWSQLWIPVGFLHGFCTLTENAEVQYKCTDFWDKETERSVLWNSPGLRIDWPVKENEAVLSEKDLQAPKFLEVKDWFQY
ncbi:dTDP-4-dehydrorhamnose 3,5-epimerase [Entomobacter blattae]|uniref:dTDP-4-dehydrorhamnose 3,5-epimerase n=1 Tax=Entomobacter blattae TaxID=2762277 RepID=A0A7H1NPM7_9PROT|nr:dTDP-4-dehydrorhamnose 3,5-epimerase [Entomobacter blattae]QNT77737.1 dTDP-4-dehydrorhamnose 3,5-epimerase [Entomobacter blattae]